MAHVLCKLTNASALINGVRFVSTADGMLSEDIPDDVAAEFAKINGYTLVTRKGEPLPDSDEAAKPAKATKEKADAPDRSV